MILEITYIDKALAQVVVTTEHGVEADPIFIKEIKIKRSRKDREFDDFLMSAIKEIINECVEQKNCELIGMSKSTEEPCTCAYCRKKRSKKDT